MFAGNPFGIVKRERAGLGGNVQLRVEHLARSVGRVNEDGDGRRVLGKDRKRRQQNNYEIKKLCDSTTGTCFHSPSRFLDAPHGDGNKMHSEYTSAEADPMGR